MLDDIKIVSMLLVLLAVASESSRAAPNFLLTDERMHTEDAGIAAGARLRLSQAPDTPKALAPAKGAETPAGASPPGAPSIEKKPHVGSDMNDLARIDKGEQTQIEVDCCSKSSVRCCLMAK